MVGPGSWILDESLHVHARACTRYSPRPVTSVHTKMHMYILQLYVYCQWICMHLLCVSGNARVYVNVVEGVGEGEVEEGGGEVKGEQEGEGT